VLRVGGAAGALGGVINFLIAPLFGALHITTILGVQIAPGLAKADLYSKVFWWVPSTAHTYQDACSNALTPP
jgi:hypothetical protein